MRTTLRITIIILSIQLATSGAADSNDEVEHRYNKARYLLIEGDYRGVIKVYDGHWLYGSNAFLVRGIARTRLMNYEGAAQDCYEGMHSTFDDRHDDAKKSVLSNCRGLALMKAGQYYRATKSFDDAIFSLMSLDDVIHERCDKVLVGHKAWIDDDRLRELIPDFTTAYIGWRITTGILEEYLAHQFDLIQGLTSALISCKAGLVSGEFGQHADSIKFYNRAIESKPDLALAYIGRGYVKQKLELYPDALRDFDKAIELAPNDALAYYFRGETSYKLGKVKAAKQDMQTALRITKTIKLKSFGDRYRNDRLQDLIKATISSYSNTPTKMRDPFEGIKEGSEQ